MAIYALKGCSMILGFRPTMVFLAHLLNWPSNTAAVSVSGASSQYLGGFPRASVSWLWSVHLTEILKS